MIGRGGGALVYIKNDNRNFIKDTIVFKTAEVIDIFNTIYSIYFLCIYRSHGYSVMEFCSELDSILETKKCYRNLYIIGDLNIDLLNENTNHTYDLQSTRVSCLPMD